MMLKNVYHSKGNIGTTHIINLLYSSNECAHYLLKQCDYSASFSALLHLLYKMKNSSYKKHLCNQSSGLAVLHGSRE